MKKALLIILLLCVLTFLTVLLLGYFTGYEIYRDVRYGNGAENVMDVYIPKEAYENESNGCVLFIHGGSWSGGDKAEESPRCRLVAAKGYIAATMNYTLRTEDTTEKYNVFSVLDEIDAALECVKEFAAELGIKVDKAATSGYSAGAHLSMLYSYSRADTAPVEIFFVSNMAGPAVISEEAWGSDMARAIATLLTGTEVTEAMLDSEDGRGILASVSPVSYIDSDTPPTMIIHGAKDDIVPIANAQSLMRGLEQSGIPFDYVHLEDSGHSLIRNPIKHISYYGLLLSYCEKYFN